MNIIIEEIVSEFPVVITEEVVQIEISDVVSYFDIVEVADRDFVGKDGYVPTVDETSGKIILKEPTSSSGGSPTGNAGGDLGGTYPNPTVPALANKVDKVSGKSLILDTEITRLATVDNFDNSGNITALSNKADLVGGVVPSAQLPSFVDDVLEYANLASFPVTGESGKIYLAIDTNKSYRWSGSTYVHLDDSIALGETSSTAYRGDRGKIAYDHSQDVTTNPHNVTKSQVGLGSVDNTADTAKPVSTAQQTALDLKVDKNSPITGATKTKVTYDAKGLVTAGADATTADIADSTNKRYVSDAQLVVIGNTSNTNSGDNATNTQYSGLAADIATRTKIIIKDVTTSTGVNSSTAETVLTSYLITAGTFASSDIMNIVSNRFKSSGIGGTVTYRHYINTSNSLSGATLIGGFLQAGATALTSKIANKSYTIAGGNLEGLFTVGSASNIDSGASTSALGSMSFNVANSYYFIVTAQCSASNLNNARQTELLITN